MKNIRKLLALATGMRRYFVIITVTSVLGALLSLASPFVIKYATNWIVSIVTHQSVFSWGVLLIIVGMFIVIAVLGTAAGDIGGYFGDQMSIRTRRQLSKLYYEHLLILPQKYYDGEVTGKVINRLSRAITDISQFLQFFANNLLQMLLTLVITIGILAWYSWPLALLFILLVPASIYLAGRSSGPWQKIESKKNKHFDIASGRFAEVIGQIRLVKSFGTEARELEKFDGRIAEMVGLTREQSRYWHTHNALRGITFGVINGAMAGLIFYNTATGRFSLGDMTMLLTLTAQVNFPMRNLSFFVDSYQRAAANSKDYLAALQEIPEAEDASAQPLTVKTGKIEYKKVDFAYGDKEQVLHGVSFGVEAGSKMALVGESGGGKTTISNILMRLYEPNAGQVLIDDQDISSVSRTSLRQSIATVFQDAALFSGSIRENIAYAKPDASEAEIEKAARVANAYDFINKFDDGLDTEIGERGIKLSGGQKQRIAIARAVLKDAPILILDEATSSLDSRAERDVQEALERLMKGRTTLIIAHRLSTIAHVDRIVTLKNGHVDEVGTPGELSKTGGIYNQLLDLQLGATEKAKKQLKSYEIVG